MNDQHPPLTEEQVAIIEKDVGAYYNSMVGWQAVIKPIAAVVIQLIASHRTLAQQLAQAEGKVEAYQTGLAVRLSVDGPANVQLDQLDCVLERLATLTALLRALPKYTGEVKVKPHGALWMVKCNGLLIAASMQYTDATALRDLLAWRKEQG